MSDDGPEHGDIRLVAETSDPIRGDPKPRIVVQEWRGHPYRSWGYKNAISVPSAEHMRELRDSIDEWLSEDDYEPEDTND